MKKLMTYAEHKIAHARAAHIAGASGAGAIDANNALTVLRTIELVYEPRSMRVRDKLRDLRLTARNYL